MILKYGGNFILESLNVVEILMLLVRFVLFFNNIVYVKCKNLKNLKKLNWDVFGLGLIVYGEVKNLCGYLKFDVFIISSSFM